MDHSTALMGRELFGSRHGHRIDFSLRSYIKRFVSREQDIYQIIMTQPQPLPVFASDYCHLANNGNYIALAGEEGTIAIIDTSKDNQWELVNGRAQWSAHDNSIFELKWSPNDHLIASVCGDQTTKIWDVETQTEICSLIGHEFSVKSVSFNPRNPDVLVTASRDGSVMVWDLRCAPMLPPDDADSTLVPARRHRPVDVIANAHSTEYHNSKSLKRRRAMSPGPAPKTQSISVTSVVFLPHTFNTVASAGAADGTIKLWDLRHHGYFSKRFSSLSIHPDGHKLFAACTDHRVYEFSAYTLGEPLFAYSAKTLKTSSFYVKTTVSPDGRFVASGSMDGGVHIWELGRRECAPIVLRGHEKEVTSVSWSKRTLDQMIRRLEYGASQA
ncbi:WD40-repeat-containing domain protein [Polychytrium aggregatum]|uniref:WD40-repeat-containing domain protein n=1 Tax=Polychytrium aggregatum TaxID=110093 RepID=UPI0022FE237A|nr:WD40-repeat-containing domain protein [Polychytrium aggregatum]KAI9209660.1 WD40-repeat-containing domain protein [Polychytrium aggregatum]